LAAVTRGEERGGNFLKRGGEGREGEKREDQSDFFLIAELFRRNGLQVWLLTCQGKGQKKEKGKTSFSKGRKGGRGGKEKIPVDLCSDPVFFDSFHKFAKALRRRERGGSPQGKTRHISSLALRHCRPLSIGRRKKGGAPERKKEGEREKGRQPSFISVRTDDFGRRRGTGEEGGAALSSLY